MLFLTPENDFAGTDQVIFPIVRSPLWQSMFTIMSEVSNILAFLFEMFGHILLRKLLLLCRPYPWMRYGKQQPICDSFPYQVDSGQVFNCLLLRFGNPRR